MSTTDTPPPENRHRSPWMWVSGVLLLACAGLLIWGLSVNSDLDSTQKDVQALQAQLDENKQQGATVGAALQTGYEALMGQIGATQADVDAAAESIDQAKQTLRIFHNTFRHIDLLVIHGAIDFLFEHFGITQNGIQWCAKLV